MNARFRSFVLALVLPLLSALAAMSPACSPPKGDRAPDGLGPSPGQTSPPAPLASPSPGAPDEGERLTLQERLAREAASRPAGGLRAEAVAAAFARDGIALSPWQQVLARTVGARFCLAAHSAAGLGVSVCEFRDPADAARGLAGSHATFDRLIPNRRLESNRGTVLTLTRAPAAPPALDREAARAARLFASL